MKKGISLIVLVITIIVMIILAASVVITLSNTGVIDRAGEAVDLTNESQVQDLAALIWADAYMDGKRGTTLETEVTTKLSEQGITSADWNITVSDTGVSVTNKNTQTGLGSLITADNYGDTVDYSVTVDGTTYSEWQIFYEDEDNKYVFLISKLPVERRGLSILKNVSDLTEEEKQIYKIFKLNQNGYTLTDSNNSSKAIVDLLVNFKDYANITDYNSNVVGAIGGPTVELFAAAWNKKGYSPNLSLSIEANGYKINNAYGEALFNDEFYVNSTYGYWLASPNAAMTDIVIDVGALNILSDNYATEVSIRPVVCLKASIPATVGTTTDFSLVK